MNSKKKLQIRDNLTHRLHDSIRNLLSSGDIKTSIKQYDVEKLNSLKTLLQDCFFHEYRPKELVDILNEVVSLNNTRKAQKDKSKKFGLSHERTKEEWLLIKAAGFAEQMLKINSYLFLFIDRGILHRTLYAENIDEAWNKANDFAKIECTGLKSIILIKENDKDVGTLKTFEHMLREPDGSGVFRVATLCPEYKEYGRI
jgi:hypothetical protein